MLSVPKTKSGQRTIKLGPSTLEILKEHRSLQYHYRLCRDPVWEEYHLMFTQGSGAPYGPRQIQRAFKALLATAGLPKMRFHDLRHTAATHMLANGIDLLTVARRLGHAKASTTLDTYGHLVPWTQEKAAAVMDEITTPVALPEELTSKRASDSVAPQGGIAPGLHQKPE